MESTKRCPFCGQEISADANVCPFCGRPVAPAPQVIINQSVQKSNGCGTAGFVIALISLVFCWVPVLDWILWLVGLILSFIGVFKAPRGLAIAGLIISLISIIAIILLVVFVGAAFGALGVLDML